jgi:hypothetical protein
MGKFEFQKNQMDLESKRAFDNIDMCRSDTIVLSDEKHRMHMQYSADIINDFH